MTLQFVPTVMLYFISIVIAATLAFVTWRMKPERAGTWIAILVFMVIWTLGGILELFFTDLQQKTVAITAVTYLGVAGVVFFWGLFTIIYSNHENWLNKYTIALLAFIPVTHYLLLNTNQWHHFFWKTTSMIEKNGFVFFEGEHGFWFPIWVIYAYSVIILGSLLLITAVIRSPRVYQGQALMIFLGALFPLVTNFFYLIGINPIAPLDLSPVSFVISGIFITIGLLRFQLFNITPVAYDLIIKSVTSGVLLFDLKQTIIDVNPAAETILGHRKNQLIGKNIFAVFPEYKAFMQQFQATDDTTVEITLGPNHPVYEVKVMPFNNRRGNLDGQIVLLYDVTERIRASEERDKLIDELDAYASTVAHDLKNPLGLIVGQTAVIKRKNKEPLPQQVQTSLDIIAQTSMQMAQIVDSLLLLANVRNVDDIKRDPLDTAVLINNAWNKISDLATPANAQLIQPDTWPTALGYAPWIEQVWSNYLSNAIKYGGNSPRIQVGADSPNETANGQTPHIRFWVRDNGNGLSAEESAQLFQEFSRLDQHSKLQGHGLGLSIVKRILEKLGGTFGVESQLGQGSTFYFTLPIALEPDSREIPPEQIKSS